MTQAQLPNAKQVVIQLTTALYETVVETGERGAPAGPMYAAFMSTGLSLAGFEAIMAALVKAGKVRKVGHCYYAVTSALNQAQRRNSARAWLNNIT